MTQFIPTLLIFAGLAGLIILIARKYPQIRSLREESFSKKQPSLFGKLKPAPLVKIRFGRSSRIFEGFLHLA
ncbi:MAG: hypothetical protein HY460_01730, partial [Parcubacteria group bacterium]|nr:hypothetical protein [Parcubacteria group bacterium]